MTNCCGCGMLPSSTPGPSLGRVRGSDETWSDVTIEQLTDWLRRFRALADEHQTELTELDSVIGDADHGANMARGMTAVVAKLDAETAANIAELFKSVGMTLVTSVGGASGPLYGTFFLRFGMSGRPGDGAGRRRHWARRCAPGSTESSREARRSSATRRCSTRWRPPSTHGTRRSPPGDRRPTRSAAALAAAEVGPRRDDPARGAQGARELSRRAQRRPPRSRRRVVRRCCFARWPTVSGADVIGIVVVSHSPALARAAVDLALEMARRLASRDPDRRRRRGRSDGDGCRRDRRRDRRGRFARRRARRDGSRLRDAQRRDGAGVHALRRAACVLSDAPFVEGLIAAVVVAGTGASLDAVDAEARRALAGKTAQLEDGGGGARPPSEDDRGRPPIRRRRRAPCVVRSRASATRPAFTRAPPRCSSRRSGATTPTCSVTDLGSGKGPASGGEPHLADVARRHKGAACASRPPVPTPKPSRASSRSSSPTASASGEPATARRRRPAVPRMSTTKTRVSSCSSWSSRPRRSRTPGG